MKCSLFFRSTVARTAAVATGTAASLLSSTAGGSHLHHGSICTAHRTASSTTRNPEGITPAPKPKVVHYSKLGMDGFTDVKYNTAADGFLENVEAKLDALESPELEDISYNSGVLTIETASKGTFILNKQAPNVQLWLSSPVSGPHHYDMVTSTNEGVETVHWRSDNDQHDLQEKLEAELGNVLHQPFQL